MRNSKIRSCIHYKRYRGILEFESKENAALDNSGVINIVFRLLYRGFHIS